MKTIMTLAVVWVSTALTCHAVLWGSYSNMTPVVNEELLGTPSQGNPNDGQDIIAVGYGESATHHYFKIELEAAPSATLDGQLNYAGYYGVYIDADNDNTTGADGNGWDYITDAVNGIEYILDTHYDPIDGGYWRYDLHDYTSGIWVRTDLSSTEHEETGVILEWAIAKSYLSGEFKFWVASHDHGSSAPTYDIEGSWVVPEPTSALLIGVVSGFGLFIRRRVHG